MNTNQRLFNELNARKDSNSLRTLRTQENLIDFCSNDYLGLSTNTRLQDRIHWEFHNSNKKTGSGGSRLLSGNYPQLEELEKLLAETHHQETALLFNSGYNANLAFFSTIPKKGDLILYDDLIHACIKDGARLSFAKHQSFRHNDIQDLQRKIEKSSEKNIFVAVESIYSMDGDIAPLVELTNICDASNIHLVIDEAHSTGAFGEHGSGLVSQLQLDDKVFCKIHTFGKAIGAHGAVITGSQILKEYLINFARPFIYTTSLPLHNIISIHEAYKFIAEFDFLQKQLQENIFLFTQTVKHSHSPQNAPIQSILIPGNEKVKSIAKKLQSKGYNVKAVLSPTVKPGTERLRICIHQNNSSDHIKELATTINGLI
ncbi:8-amino-7-oxononanoate synthase [Cyclobacteriaceae bacterium]|nr:8-amino-7-oxononanoate synthase [Cyclobacteriaceae bacterium]